LNAGLKRYVMAIKCCLRFCMLLLLTIANLGCAGSSDNAHRLSVSESNLNFGNVTVGSGSVLAVTLRNSGSARITISNTSISGPGFNASGFSAGTFLDPGKDAILNITFAPAAVGDVSGKLTIMTNDIYSPVTINLSGTGGNTAGANTITSITVTPADPILVPGSQLQFRAIDDLGNDISSSVVWGSSNTSVATITSRGLVTAIANGSVTITATE
jgi:Bacterial Ig-like domain (group 2)/Abnormal spindle-like microcephaly-assoc'd, ASPM-SPD-2-Hydin